jgi:hypothetical protein
MGSMTGIELATNLDLPLEKAIGYHLQGNHYPPVPLSMVQPCIDAIDAIHAGESDAPIALPEGVRYKDRTTAPAWAIANAHHLDFWLPQDDEDFYGAEDNGYELGLGLE